MALVISMAMNSLIRFVFLKGSVAMLLRQQSGFTLVELMVAMVVGTVIILGAGHLFLTTFQTFESVKEISRKQEVLVFASNAIVDHIRESVAADPQGYGTSGYELDCTLDDDNICECIVRDKNNSNEPVVEFDKQLKEPGGSNGSYEEQCDASDAPDMGTDPDSSATPPTYRYEVSLPLAIDGEAIRFNIASRAEILDQYSLGDSDNEDNGGDTGGDAGDENGTEKTPDPNNPGFYTDGSRMYSDNCYAGNSDQFKPKFKGCEAP
jgi:prepilin-type N-terminal cleavage/methylation domain-containing protein